MAACRKLTEKGLVCLRRLEHLTSLNINRLPAVSDAVLDSLHTLPLTELWIGYPYGPSYTAAGLTRYV